MASQDQQGSTVHLRPDALSRLMLDQYGLSDARLTPVRDGDNNVFRADLPSGECFALRVHTAQRHTAAMLASELDWLDVLGRAQLPVPSPVRCTSGSWVATLPSDSAAPVLCTLLTWLEGRSLPEGQKLTENQAEHVGGLLAQLHLQAELFSAPPDFDRPAYDAPLFLTVGSLLQQRLSISVNASRLTRLEASLRRLVHDLGPLSSVTGGFGLIHADAHPGNFLQQTGGLALVDFDRCGWGPFLLDLAHADLALDAPGRAALIAGYTRFRPLPLGYERPLKTLRVLAAVENLAFLSRRADELPFVLESLPVIDQALSTMVETGHDIKSRTP